MGAKMMVFDLVKPLLGLAKFYFRVFTGFSKPLCLLGLVENDGG